MNPAVRKYDFFSTLTIHCIHLSTKMITNPIEILYPFLFPIKTSCNYPQRKIAIPTERYHLDIAVCGK